jgi:putative tricarboxylic transport membrane protein
VGYAMRIFGFPFLPAVLGVVLCPLVESSYRRSLVLAAGDHGIFVEDRICLGLLIAAALFLAFSMLREFRAAAKSAEVSQGTP